MTTTSLNSGGLVDVGSIHDIVKSRPVRSREHFTGYTRARYWHVSGFTPILLMCVYPPLLLVSTLITIELIHSVILHNLFIRTETVISVEAA